MKKLIALLLAVVLCVGIFTGCNNNTTDPTTPDNVTDPTDTDVTGENTSDTAEGETTTTTAG